MKFSLKKTIKNILGFEYAAQDFGSFDKTSIIQSPEVISNPKNIFIGDHVNMGANAILYATNAKIIIKRYFVSGRGLKIATGQHERRVGRFLASITEEEKNHNIGLDKDVIINEDVWAGMNVTIMAGVEIGRGCTIASGAVVTKDTPPYSIVGGVPAKVLKFYWSVDEILSHEKQLYLPNDRFSFEEIKLFFNKYKR